MSFQDSFWGEEGKGFGVLLHRLKYGRRTTEALLSFLATRIEIEEEYVKKLQRLGNFTFPREELFYGEKLDGDAGNIQSFDLVGALLNLPLQTGELCKKHVTLVESLKQRLLWPLQHSLKEQSVVKDQHKDEMVQIVRAKIWQEENVTKLKDRYFTRCKEKAMLVDANVSGLSGRQLEKHENKLRKAKEAEQESDAEYRKSTYKLGEYYNQWHQRMTTSMNEFQVVEETRLELMKHIIVEYGIISQCHVQEQVLAYEQVSERALQCDRVLEMKDFIRRRATGSTKPSCPVYINFEGESVEESLRRLSLRSTQSPRKLYNDIGEPSRIAGMYTESQRMGRNSVSSWATTSTASSSNNSFSSKLSQSSTTKSSELFKVVTMYAYEGQESDELSFQENQVITVYSTNEDPWWYGSVEGKNSRKALFPSNYVERI